MDITIIPATQFWKKAKKLLENEIKEITYITSFLQDEVSKQLTSYTE